MITDITAQKAAEKTAEKRPSYRRAPVLHLEVKSATMLVLRYIFLALAAGLCAGFKQTVFAYNNIRNHHNSNQIREFLQQQQQQQSNVNNFLYHQSSLPHYKDYLNSLRMSGSIADSDSITKVTNQNVDRKELWKLISNLEKQAVDLLSNGDDSSKEKAYKLLSQSIALKKNDPFLQSAAAYSIALEKNDVEECNRLLTAMKSDGAPPHLESLANKKSSIALQSEVVQTGDEKGEEGASSVNEDFDPGSNFSDTVTEKIRVKVSSYYDNEKSDPANGKYMFWYKVGIYNEGPEPVQVVARMWEIDKCIGEKEIVRGAGIMSTQPIISPGDVFTYQSVCPLKIFPPKGLRVLGSMSGAYTMCKGNMGQHNFTAKVGKFNLILPENKMST